VVDLEAQIPEFKHQAHQKKRARVREGGRKKERKEEMLSLAQNMEYLMERITVCLLKTYMVCGFC
jgi:hypothetical protein